MPERDEHDLGRLKGGKRILDGGQWVCVGDLAAGSDPAFLQAGDRELEPPMRPRERAVGV